MARLVDRLTHRTVQTLKEPGLHADGRGLYLEVTPSGAKRWTLVFQWRGARKQMGLGSVELVGLGQAREAATAARKLVAEGVNPIDERKARRARGVGTTFGDAADALMASLEPAWRNAKHKAQWKTSLEVHAAALRALPVDAVGTGDVLDALKPIWSKIPETAARTRGRIERVLDAARAKGWRQGENPARWRGHLQLLLPRRKRLYKGHHPALPFVEIGAFMADLRARPAMAARALEHTILSAARTSETLGAARREFDLDAAVWTIPPERMKAGQEHRVALSKANIELLRPLLAMVNDPEGLVFRSPSGGGLSTGAMKALLRRMGYAAERASVHGFRSTFKDWASEATSFADVLSEEALAHVVGSETRRAYRRGDALERRRKLMEAWAGYCGRGGGGEVVQLRRV